MNVAGRPALVTGASSGIGAAVARRLAGVASPLVVTGRHPQRLHAVAADTGGIGVVADLTADEDRDRVVDAVAADGAGLVVLAAGVGAAGPLDELGPPGVAALLATDLTAPAQLVASLLPSLRASGGHVVLVASIAALGVAGEAGYSAAKGGLRAFGDALRLEGGVGVTTVLPGAVDTPFLARRGYDRAVPRAVPPDAVARALLAGVARDRPEVFVPRWLGLAARVHGAAPRTFARLSRRFG